MVIHFQLLCVLSVSINQPCEWSDLAILGGARAPISRLPKMKPCWFKRWEILMHISKTLQLMTVSDGGNFARCSNNCGCSKLLVGSVSAWCQSSGKMSGRGMMSWWISWTGDWSPLLMVQGSGWPISKGMPRNSGQEHPSSKWNHLICQSPISIYLSMFIAAVMSSSS